MTGIGAELEVAAYDITGPIQTITKGDGPFTMACSAYVNNSLFNASGASFTGQMLCADGSTLSIANSDFDSTLASAGQFSFLLPVTSAALLMTIPNAPVNVIATIATTTITFYGYLQAVQARTLFY